MLHFLDQMSNMHGAINYLFFSILGFGVCCMLTYVGINLIFLASLFKMLLDFLTNVLYYHYLIYLSPKYGNLCTNV
jgi:hypothetical protein